MSDNSEGSQQASIPDPPRKSRADARKLESYEPLASGDEKEFIRRVTTNYPDLAMLMSDPDKEARAERMRAMSWQTRQMCYAALVSVAFQYEKRSRLADALALHRIRYELAECDSDRPLDSYCSHTQARNLGDSMHEIGSAQE